VSRIAQWALPTFLVFFTLAWSPAATSSQDTEQVKQRYGSYTVEQAAQEDYLLDAFCLDATAFGMPAALGSMGFHATNDALLRGPIDPTRPQALMFDDQGTVLGVEYEVMVDAVPEAPQLFGQTFARLPGHAGVEHEHYALHVWFIDNPAGEFADFNPLLTCPATSTPAQAPEIPGMHDMH
jgi:hypothetical protein